MPNIDMAFKPVSDQAGRMVESSWKRILAIAQNHVQEFEQDDTSQGSSNDTRRSRSSGTSSENQPQQQPQHADNSQTEFYDRERHMVHALDTLFTLAYEGKINFYRSSE
jgi:hypothetical protein